MRERVPLLKWLAWYANRIEFPTVNQAWVSAWFSYSGEGPPALPFIMAARELGFNTQPTEGGYTLQKVN